MIKSKKKMITYKQLHCFYFTQQNFQNKAEKPRNPAADLCHQLLVRSYLDYAPLLADLFLYSDQEYFIEELQIKKIINHPLWPSTQNSGSLLIQQYTFITCTWVFFLVSQLFRYVRTCSTYEQFLKRRQVLTNKFIKQGYQHSRLESSFRKSIQRHLQQIQSLIWSHPD